MAGGDRFFEKNHTCTLEEIVASGAYAWRASDALFLLPFRTPYISHCERSCSKPCTPSTKNFPKHFLKKGEIYFSTERLFCLKFYIQNVLVTVVST